MPDLKTHDGNIQTTSQGMVVEIINQQVEQDAKSL